MGCCQRITTGTQSLEDAAYSLLQMSAWALGGLCHVMSQHGGTECRLPSPTSPVLCLTSCHKELLARGQSTEEIGWQWERHRENGKLECFLPERLNVMPGCCWTPPLLPPVVQAGFLSWQYLPHTGPRWLDAAHRAAPGGSCPGMRFDCFPKTPVTTSWLLII